MVHNEFGYLLPRCIISLLGIGLLDLVNGIVDCLRDALIDARVQVFDPGGQMLEKF